MSKQVGLNSMAQLIQNTRPAFQKIEIGGFYYALPYKYENTTFRGTAVINGCVRKYDQLRIKIAGKLPDKPVGYIYIGDGIVHKINGEKEQSLIQYHFYRRL